MLQAQLAARIDGRVKKTVEIVCKTKGLKINKFVEEALLDKLEEMEDLEEIRSLRREQSRPLSEIIKDLKAHGKL